MAISKDDVLRVAHLARINLTEEELNIFSEQLEDILSFIDKLKNLDVSSVKPTNHVLNLHNISRADSPKPSLKQEETLKNAPDSFRNHFKVPKII